MGKMLCLLLMLGLTACAAAPVSTPAAVTPEVGVTPATPATTSAQTAMPVQHGNGNLTLVEFFAVN